MITQREALINFLDKVMPTHKYTPEMEVQVIVKQGKGERISGTYKGRKSFAYRCAETGAEWSPFRIPYNAWSAPEYSDKAMTYDLMEHAEGVGMTGYDWVNKKSRWVAYDFDSMIGHAEGLTPDELKSVEQAATEIPWVTVQKSKSGKGLHLYVYLDLDITVENHTQHAAIARCILHKMCGLVGFNFSKHVDICGGNMWIWHRDIGPGGFDTIKSGSKLDTLPINWQDHMTKSRKSYGRNVDKLLQSTDHHKFEEEHLKVINWLEDMDSMYWYDADHHMVVTHTTSLKRCHDALNLIGEFETISLGENPNEQNCFMYPLPGGGWVVRRYSKGTAEHGSWFQDGNGWTRTYLNRQPTLAILALRGKALEHPSGGYVFSTVKQLADTLTEINVEFDYPTQAEHLSVHVTAHERELNKVVLEINADAGFQHAFKEGWIQKTKSKFIKIVTISIEKEESYYHYDDLIRHLVDPKNQNAGWAVNIGSSWVLEPATHVQMAIEAEGLKSNEARKIMGTMIAERSWRLTVEPFKPEYPGNRLWNRNSARLKYEAKEGIEFHTWLMILEHLGKSLDEAVKKHPWCSETGIYTGAEYLFFWIASLFQYPTEPLPYLFFYGETQRTGKTTFHEALKTLFINGYQEANIALSDVTSFNAELEGVVLCVVEEVDLSQWKRASNKIKQWVTGDSMTIHPKGKTPYMVKNSSHWIQTGNSRDNCPVFSGDTRITYIYVNQRPEKEIPRTTLFSKLDTEAPGFLHALLNLEIPSSETRLRIPCIQTEDKVQAMKSQEAVLVQFIEENCFQESGYHITLADFKERFYSTLKPHEVKRWTGPKINAYMVKNFPRGKIQNAWSWGNLTFDKDAKDYPKTFVYVIDKETGTLKKENLNV